MDYEKYSDTNFLKEGYTAKASIKCENSINWLLDSDISEKYVHHACSYLNTAFSFMETILKELIDLNKFNDSVKKAIEIPININGKKMDPKETLISKRKLTKIMILLSDSIKSKGIREFLISGIKPIEDIYTSYSVECRTFKKLDGITIERESNQIKQIRSEKIGEFIKLLKRVEEKVKIWQLKNRPYLLQEETKGDQTMRDVIQLPFLLQARIKYIVWCLSTEDQRLKFSCIPDIEQTRRVNVSHHNKKAYVPRIQDNGIIKKYDLVSTDLEVQSFTLMDFWNSIQMMLHHSNTMCYSETLENFYDQLYTCCGKFLSHTYRSTDILNEPEFTQESSHEESFPVMEKGKKCIRKRIVKEYAINLVFMKKIEMIFYGFQMMFSYRQYIMNSCTVRLPSKISEESGKEVMNWIIGKNLSNRSLLEPVQRKIEEQMYKMRLIMGEYETYRINTKMTSESSALGSIRPNVHDHTIRLLQDEVLSEKDGVKYKKSLPERMMLHLFELYYKREVIDNPSAVDRSLDTIIGCTERECASTSLIVVSNNVNIVTQSDIRFEDQYVITKDKWIYPPEKIIKSPLPIFVEIFNQFFIVHKSNVYLTEDIFTAYALWANILCDDPYMKGRIYDTGSAHIIELAMFSADKNRMEELKELKIKYDPVIDRSEVERLLPKYYEADYVDEVGNALLDIEFDDT